MQFDYVIKILTRKLAELREDHLPSTCRDHQITEIETAIKVLKGKGYLTETSTGVKVIFFRDL